MLNFLLWTLMLGSLGLGILSGTNYLRFATAAEQLFGHSKGIKYTGGKFWLVAFVCLLALYLKG